MDDFSTCTLILYIHSRIEYCKPFRFDACELEGAQRRQLSSNRFINGIVATFRLLSKLGGCLLTFRMFVIDMHSEVRGDR